MKYEYVGVDISKNKFDVYFQDNSWIVKQTEQAIEDDFVTRLQKIKETTPNIVVVCEASGGYEKLLTEILAKNHIAYHVANARYVKAYIQSKGCRVKTDKKDAENIAGYAQENSVLPDTILSKNKLRIGNFLKRREQLVESKAREKKCLDKHHPEDTKQSILDHIDWLEKEIAKLEKELTAIANADEEIEAQMKLFTSLPGVGKIIALSSIAFLPELGQITNKQASALVGLAPYNRDSGKYQGKRFIQGGRARIRSLFYLSAVTNLRHNPELKAFYDRLRSKGKSARVAIVAVARKVVCLLNSIATRKTEWVKKELLAH